MYQAVRAAAATNVDELQGLLLNLENVLIQENAEFFGSDPDHEPDHGHVSSRNDHDLEDLDEDPAPDRVVLLLMLSTLLKHFCVKTRALNSTLASNPNLGYVFVGERFSKSDKRIRD